MLHVSLVKNIWQNAYVYRRSLPRIVMTRIDSSHNGNNRNEIKWSNKTADAHQNWMRINDCVDS